MGSSQRIAKGVFWTTLVNLVNGLYGFISVPILLAYFGKSDYGLIGLAMSVNVYLRLMDMGLNSTNVRFFSNWISRNEYAQGSADQGTIHADSERRKGASSSLRYRRREA